jgi:IS30 family transposase
LRYLLADHLVPSCREVNRNTANGQVYRAVKAHHRAIKLTHLARKKRKMDINLPLKHYVLEHLDQLWSPEQIAKRLKILYPNDMIMKISHESIYSYLYILPRGTLSKELVKCLRRQHINRRPRGGKSRQKSYPIQDYISNVSRSHFLQIDNSKESNFRDLYVKK